MISSDESHRCGMRGCCIHSPLKVESDLEVEETVAEKFWSCTFTKIESLSRCGESRYVVVKMKPLSV